MNRAKSAKLEKALDDARQRFLPLIAVFSSQIGIDALSLLEEEFIFQPTHVKGDSHESAYLEGQRALVLWIRDIVSTHGE